MATYYWKRLTDVSGRTRVIRRDQIVEIEEDGGAIIIVKTVSGTVFRVAMTAEDLVAAIATP